MAADLLARLPRPRSRLSRTRRPSFAFIHARKRVVAIAAGAYNTVHGARFQVACSLHQDQDSHFKSCLRPRRRHLPNRRINRFFVAAPFRNKPTLFFLFFVPRRFFHLLSCGALQTETCLFNESMLPRKGYNRGVRLSRGAQCTITVLRAEKGIDHGDQKVTEGKSRFRKDQSIKLVDHHAISWHHNLQCHRVRTCSS